MRFSQQDLVVETVASRPAVEVGRNESVRVISEGAPPFGRFVWMLARFGIRRWLALIDAGVVAVALGTGGFGLWWPMLATAATLAVNHGLHLYRSRLSLSALDDLPRLVMGVAVAAALAAAVATVTGRGDLGAEWWVRTAVAATMVVAGRAAGYTTVRAARRRRYAGHRTLIVGTDPVARHLAELMVTRPACGLQPVAFFDPRATGERVGALPVHRSRSLEEATFDCNANVVIIAFGDEPDYDSVQRIRDAAQLHAEIFFVPRFYELQGISSPDMDHLYDVPLFRLRRWSHRSRAWRIKRAFDATVASVGLAALSPLLAAVALAIRLTMGNPILFRQQRIGLDGEPFTILKFRSLPNAPAEVSDADWNSQTTRQPNAVGRFIRATSIDELPQLWNVLRGDMSLVGPRPERPNFVDDFTKLYPDYRQRHRVPVGITGLAQVEGLRGDTPIADRARFDNLYVENWSLWGDIKILLRTVSSVLRREGG